MKTWTRTIIVGAALLAGCEGSIGSKEQSSGSGASSGSGTAGSVGTGNTVGTGTAGSGTAGTTVIPPVDPTVCTPGIPATSQLPRLTRAEYDKTTRDLLGLDVQPSTMLAPDTLGSVDQRAWDGFQVAGGFAGDAGHGQHRGAGQGAPVHDGQRDLHRAVHHGVRAEGVPPSAHDGGGGALPGAVHEPRDDHAGRNLRSGGAADHPVVPACRRRSSASAEVSEAAPDGSSFALDS